MDNTFIEYTMWIVAISSMIGTLANIHKKRWCFHIWLVCNIAWVAYDIHKTAYPQAVLMAVYAILAVYGIYKWKNKEM